MSMINMIKRAAISNPGLDTGIVPKQQLSYMGGSGDSEMIYPYGSGGVAPGGAFCIVYSLQGDEGNRVAIATTPDLRPKGLKPGEFYCGNLVTGSIMIFAEDGKLNATIKGDVNLTVEGDVNVTANTVNLTANVNLGTGGPAIARVGDTVNDINSPFSPIGLIGTGSGKHTAD